MSAKRYAKALFDVGLSEKADLAQIDRDLTSLTEVVNEHADLLKTATRANVPEATRKDVVNALSSKLGLGPHVTKLFAMLGGKGALEIVPAIAGAYRERLLAHQNIVQAEVTSAVPLAPEKTKALEESLAKVTGKKVELSVRVDSALLGGVVARIGSTVYDGSVKMQLKNLRKTLVEQ